MVGADQRGKTGAWNVTQKWPGLYGGVDAGLARALQCLFGNSSVLDVGAGAGQYGGYFGQCDAGDSAREDGIPRWRGIDGNPSIQFFTSPANGAPQGAHVRHEDFCSPRDLSSVKQRDWVMSLEVGEHLPESCIPNYLALINATAILGVVLAWGPDHRGRGHISPLSPKNVARRLQPFGLVPHEQLSSLVRSHAVMPWLLTDTRVYLRENASEPLHLRLSNSSSTRPWPWMKREIMPYECRTNRHACGYGKCHSRYPRDDCVTMAARCPCPFALSPWSSDPVLEARLSRKRMQKV